MKQFHKVQLILKIAGQRNPTFLIDFLKSTQIKHSTLQLRQKKTRLRFLGTDILLKFQLIGKVKIFNLSTLIMPTKLMDQLRDITVFNSISMLVLNIPLKAKDTILRCTPFICHGMESNRLIQESKVSLLLQWELCSL
jgi:hypothetical protein